MIACANPKAQYDACRAEIDAAIKRVMESGWYILGREVAAFEAEFAAFVGSDHGVGVGSGTEALHLALMACGVGPGDEVISVAHTAVATIAAIRMTGARPVFADVLPDTRTMDPDSLKACITPRTRAVIPVHLYGHPAAMDEIGAQARQHGLRLIEDCAQAHGAVYRGRRVGSLGDIGCFSFYPTKNLGALGDGGMLVTSDAALEQSLRELREYGWTQRYISGVAGINSRLDELQAAVLRVKLQHLENDNHARQTLAAHYEQVLAGTDLKLPTAAPGVEHVYHLYVVRSRQRNALQRHLQQHGISAAVHYPVAVHRQPAYADLKAPPLPCTENLCREILSLPLYPQLGDHQVDAVAAAIREFTP